MRKIKTTTLIGDTIQIDTHGANIRILITDEKIILYEEKQNREFYWLCELDNKDNLLVPKNTLVKIKRHGIMGKASKWRL